MEKGILFLTITAGCLWIILDEFFGTKKVSGIVQQMTPNASLPFEKTADAVDDFFTWDVGNKGAKEIEDDRLKLKEKIKNDPNVKSDKAKKSLQDAVDHFYGQYDT